MHFLYVFILQFLYNSTRFERLFRSSSGVHKFTVSAAVYKPCWFVYIIMYRVLKCIFRLHLDHITITCFINWG